LQFRQFTQYYFEQYGMVDINNLPLTVETSHFIQCAIFSRLLKCLSGDWEALRAQ